MSHPLRILMTADTVGGVWTYCMELAAALVGKNVEIVLATMGAAPTPSQRAEAGRFRHVRLITSEFKLEWMDEPWSDVDAAGEWLLRLAGEFEPHAVHLNGYAHADLPWRVPVLVAAHSCVFSWWNAVKGGEAPASFATYGGRVARGLRKADLVVAPTQAMLAALKEQYAFSTPARVIPNGRRAALFSPGAKQPVIFSAGRVWDEAKNMALLARLAPDLAFPVCIAGRTVPAGEGKPEAVSESLSRQPPACSPVFLGDLPPDLLSRQLAKASIYAAPALYEPFGLGILEAALAGCALVLSDLASLRENWSQAALFVLPGDDGAWRKALNGLALDESRRLDLARRARERALLFTPERTADAYHAAYRILTTAHSTRLPEASLS